MARPLRTQAPPLEQEVDRRAYVTIERYCDIYDDSRNGCYNKLAAGKLRAVKDGTRTLVVVASADEYYASLPAYQPKRQPQQAA